MAEPTTNGAPAPLELRVHGLDCAEEVSILKRALAAPVGGEENLGFDVLRGKLTVLPAAGTVDREAVLAAVAATGMRAEPWDATPERPAGWRRRGRGALVAVSGLATAAGFAIHAAGDGATAALAGGVAGAPVAAPLLYALAIAAGAGPVLPKAWHAARSLRPDMHLLMTVAIGGAVAIGEWLEAATVAFLFALSLLLESWSVGRARRAVEALLDLTPPTARVRDGRGERRVPAGEVVPGTVFVVEPGERLPLDGEVIAGVGEVDQAPITGESAPVAKEPGDEVFAGTVNGTGVLEVRSTRHADQTTLAHVIRSVETARSRRSPSERWVDRFARVYTPVVLALAAAVLLVPPLLFAGDWGDWLYRSLVLLVLACPCALVISTPVSVVASLATAARSGVLVKGGPHLEAPAHLAAIAFDKTGTVTEGRFEVVAVELLGEGAATDEATAEAGVASKGRAAGGAEADLMRRAAALEARSEHPLGRAVVAEARRRGLPVEPAADLQALPGRGVTGRLADGDHWVGSHRLVAERGLASPAVEARMAAMARAGRTVVAVGDEGGVLGLLAVADAVRPEAAEAVRRLRRRGIGHLVLLTGDNRPTAESVGAALGFDEVRSELLPEDKLAAVEELVHTHGRVAMVGDGINDAPALARADLGIAMGAAGSDAAIETADVALMSDDLGRLPWLVDHSRRTLSVIRQNVAFALGVKLVVFALAVAGHATLWAAIAADMGASLAVIANGLRLLRGADGEG